MIAIINTGCANINSVRFAFERLGVTPEVITDPQQLVHFDRAILPGVGHAKVAMERLTSSGWNAAIDEYQKPLMGICLGMQLLCDKTAEGDINCLGKIPGVISQLDVKGLTAPHMGWNNLSECIKHPLTENITSNDQVYFVHSFAHAVSSVTLAQSEYGQRFSAIVAKDNYAGMQFHPERSAKIGATLLQNFLNWQL
ncbi:imidazole glycerol phosphate synthase subunit HisH [Pseudoalteromonas sp. MMG013]|uniref:imidazole glycerol phosphate synthase subunit HisH n=1 Tax=Pseudoalteromonas sp. MMG013 TaxID=2822687 RepID=UPI001B36CCEB|nr:imidazole glycerol phosphate synthase subunit HisH [Pseudoalteromonas sp. MMG013]MBQ4860280.1 imidazole glycerol phosphate synthase subunit HisH [Pseudoalteromonas sp. MMG013]